MHQKGPQPVRIDLLPKDISTALERLSRDLNDMLRRFSVSSIRTGADQYGMKIPGGEGASLEPKMSVADDSDLATAFLKLVANEKMRQVVGFPPTPNVLGDAVAHDLRGDEVRDLENDTYRDILETFLSVELDRAPCNDEIEQHTRLLAAGFCPDSLRSVCAALDSGDMLKLKISLVRRKLRPSPHENNDDPTVVDRNAPPSVVAGDRTELRRAVHAIKLALDLIGDVHAAVTHAMPSARALSFTAALKSSVVLFGSRSALTQSLKELASK